jgi:hypothetical protein
MAYEPTSAVSQGAAAGAAAFGAPQPDQSLNFAALQQQGRIAGQNLAQQQQEMQQSGQQFQQGMQLQRETQQAQAAENVAGRQHDINLEKQRNDNAKALQDQAFQRSKNLQMAELEFARANASQREQLAAKLMQIRKDAQSANAKLASYKLLTEGGQKAIGSIVEQSTQMRDSLTKAQEQERMIGAKAANSAIGRILEDMNNAGRTGYETYKNMTFGYGNDGDADIGFDLLKLSPEVANDFETGYLGRAGRMVKEAGSLVTFGQVRVNPAEELASIDDSRVQGRAAELVSRHVARAISEQVGDRFAPEEVRSMIDQMMKGDENVGDQAVLLGKMQKIGVSPEVIKSSLLHMANALDGTDAGSPLSRASIMQKMQQVEPDTAQYMALSASLKMLDTMQAKARTVAAQLQSVNINEMNEMIDILGRAATRGGRIDRSQLAGLVPAMMGSDQGSRLSRDIMENQALGELEALGPDPFGRIARENLPLQSLASDRALEEADLLMQLRQLEEGGSPATMGSYLDSLRRVQ